PGLLAGIDVQRGAVSGVHGSGALAGSVNFRTLDVSDVLLPGRTAGLLTRTSFGTNGKTFSHTTAGALRADIFDGGSIGLIGAISGSQFDFYRNGNGDIPTGINTENSPL